MGRKAAEKAYAKARREVPAGKLLVAVRRYAADPNLPGKEFIPHPATWLNEGRWDDDPLPERTATVHHLEAPRPGSSVWDRDVTGKGARA